MPLLIGKVVFISQFISAFEWVDKYLKYAGCLAQLVERRPYKANVSGSTPLAPTKS